MIYVNVNTAEEIGKVLRSEHKSVSPKIMADKIARRLMGKNPITGMVITAPRQSGKTTELLKFAEEKFRGGKFAVVCMDHESQKRIIRRHWEIFNRISQADIVAKKLLGQPLGGVDINPPLMITLSNLHLLRGGSSPIFCDEWNILDEEAQEVILNSGRFVAGVTS